MIISALALRTAAAAAAAVENEEASVYLTIEDSGSVKKKRESNYIK